MRVLVHLSHNNSDGERSSSLLASGYAVRKG